MVSRVMRKAYGLGGGTIDVLPAPILAERAPTTSDTNNPVGQLWFDQSVSPSVLYVHDGGGTWETGGNAEATTSAFGIVMLDADLTDGAAADTVPTSVATKAYVDGIAIAGAPVATEAVAGIGQLATDAEAVAGTASTPLLALFVTPSNLTPVFAAPPAIGGTTPAAGTFTDLTADGNGTVSLGANAASDFTITGAFDLTLATTLGSVVVNAGEAAADAIDLNATSGGLDVDVALLASITSTRNNAQAILLESTAGGIDILASGSGGAGEDIDIICTGGSVNISGTENAADAVTIAAANGGIDITCGGAAGEDIDLVNTSGSIHLDAGEGASDAINIDAAAGGMDVDIAGQINIASSQNAADAVVIIASAGGVDITATGTAGEDLDLLASGSSVNITATEDVSQAIYIRANGGTSETIRLHADQGTGVASINISSDVGGVTVTSGLASADAININATDAGGGIDIDSGTAGVIVDTTGAASIDAGAASNFSVSGAGIDLTLASSAGRVVVNGEEAAADAVRILSAAGGLDTNVALQLNLDSSQAAAADSVRIVASAADGGMDIDAGTGGITIDSTGAFSIDGAAASNVTTTGAGIDLTLNSVLGSVLVRSTEDAALAIRLHADGGTSETIQVHSDQGTGVGSINLLSDVGGITMTAGLATADAINLVTSNAAGGIDVDAGTNGVIVDTTGAISLDAAAASNFTATGAFDLTVASTLGSVIVSAGEAVSDAIQLTASDAAGGITLTAGTGDVNVAGDLNLTSVATKITLNGGAATDAIGTATLTAGTVTVANTNIAATDRIFLSRTAVNASTLLGELVYTISAGASFTVRAAETATPGDTEVGDVSSFSYIIFGQS